MTACIINIHKKRRTFKPNHSRENIIKPRGNIDLFQPNRSVEVRCNRVKPRPKDNNFLEKKLQSFDLSGNRDDNSYDQRSLDLSATNSITNLKKVLVQRAKNQRRMVDNK